MGGITVIEIERAWKEPVKTYFKVLYQNLTILLDKTLSLTSLTLIWQVDI